ncbi:hypothetical protein BDY21DRAFT_372421 [Lineolata rhizophorae]|uniref:Uncharacterized protein n=1 Tax=Lineolata rhizophorae TaxID=578093 RepID=A0A6A6NZ17_9PEZI|nr:hypothetical protein BDY21DRAFT_372421 [Lineolata rhizophorae]
MANIIVADSATMEAPPSEADVHHCQYYAFYGELVATLRRLRKMLDEIRKGYWSLAELVRKNLLRNDLGVHAIVFLRFLARPSPIPGPEYSRKIDGTGHEYLAILDSAVTDVEVIHTLICRPGFIHNHLVNTTAERARFNLGKVEVALEVALKNIKGFKQHGIGPPPKNFRHLPTMEFLDELWSDLMKCVEGGMTLEDATLSVVSSGYTKWLEKDL